MHEEIVRVLEEKTENTIKGLFWNSRT